MGGNLDIKTLKDGLVQVALKRKDDLLKRRERERLGRYVSLDDVINMPKLVSDLKIIGFTSDGVIEMIENFYPPEMREYDYHRSLAIDHLGISMASNPAVHKTD